MGRDAGFTVSKSGTKLVLYRKLIPILNWRNKMLFYGNNILFTNKEEGWVCACVCQGPVFCVGDQYSSVDQSDGFDSEVESVAFESKLQEFSVFAGGLCVV